MTRKRRNRIRAFCSARRTARSAVVSIGLLWLPQLMEFIKHDQFSLAELSELGRQLAVAALIVLFNFVQHLKDEKPPRRRKSSARANDKENSRAAGSGSRT